MKIWKVNIFDENKDLIKTEKVESNSKYYIKKIAANIAKNTKEGDSYSYSEIKEKDEKDK